MERRVTGRVVGFLIGSAGVVLAVLVVLPWLETPDESVEGRESRDAIVEERLASFGEEDGAEEGDTGNGSVEEPAVMAAPSALLPMGAEGPPFGPELEPGSEAGTAQVDSEAPQAADDGSETRSLEETAVVTSDVESAGTGAEAEWEDGPPGTERRLEPVVATPDVSPEPAETFHAAQEVAGAPVAPQEVASVPEAPQEVAGASEAPQTLGMQLPVPVEPPLPTEPVRHAQPLSGSGSLLTGPTGQPTGSGLPRPEFETPKAVQLDATPLQAGDRRPSSNPAALAEPLSEFSPRSISGSTAQPAADRSDAVATHGDTVDRLEARDRRQARADTPQAYRDPVPRTLRGVMGYRLPLVSRQELPDQVVSGVLIPAHTTYVILQPGHWELVGLSPDDVVAIRAAAERSRVDEQASPAKPAGRGWNPFRLFGKRRAAAAGD